MYQNFAHNKGWQFSLTQNAGKYILLLNWFNW
jgi:hypothetical protein